MLLRRETMFWYLTRYPLRILTRAAHGSIVLMRMMREPSATLLAERLPLRSAIRTPG